MRSKNLLKLHEADKPQEATWETLPKGDKGIFELFITWFYQFGIPKSNIFIGYVKRSKCVFKIKSEIDIFFYFLKICEISLFRIGENGS